MRGAPIPLYLWRHFMPEQTRPYLSPLMGPLHLVNGCALTQPALFEETPGMDVVLHYVQVG